MCEAADPRRAACAISRYAAARIPPSAGVHRDCGPDAGGRHRRQRGGLLHRSRRADAAARVWRSRSVDVGDEGRPPDDRPGSSGAMDFAAPMGGLEGRALVRRRRVPSEFRRRDPRRAGTASAARRPLLGERVEHSSRAADPRTSVSPGGGCRRRGTCGPHQRAPLGQTIRQRSLDRRSHGHRRVACRTR